MVMRDIDSLHFVEPRFISQGTAKGNETGQQRMVNVCIGNTAINLVC